MRDARRHGKGPLGPIVIASRNKDDCGRERPNETARTCPVELGQPPRPRADDGNGIDKDKEMLGESTLRVACSGTIQDTRTNVEAPLCTLTEKRGE